MKEAGLLTLTESKWRKAKRRKDVIAPLAALEVVGQKAVEEAAASLGITTRHLYRLMKRYKAVDRRVTDLISAQPRGGRGKSRLVPEVEVIVRD
ncbi:MAG: helix-turn-helix domain-containing protein [Cyanobacteriota/Melainabacteria group bacterium]